MEALASENEKPAIGLTEVGSASVLIRVDLNVTVVFLSIRPLTPKRPTGYVDNRVRLDS
jgi:hypothetical protein